MKSSSIENSVSTGPLVPLRRARTENRAIFLVALDWTRDKDPRVPLGHAALIASLRATPGVELSARSWSMNRPEFDIARVADEILEWERRVGSRPHDLAVGVYIWNERLVQVLLPLLRRRGFAGRILLGGPQISYAPIGVADLYPDADCFIRGYGETALAAVAATSERLPVHGVTWRGQPDGAERAEADLASLPSPLLTGAVPIEGQHYLRWETQRGCPYRCTFCQHRESGARLRNSKLPLGRLVEEIDLFARHDIRDIDVLDPIFNVGDMHLQILEELIRKRVGARLSLQCRFELLTPEFLDLCQRLNVRLEFGLQTIHEREWRAVARANQMHKVEAGMADLDRRRIPYLVTLIYGLPEQTIETFRATVDFCLGKRVPIVRAFPLNLLRGTELERDRDRWGLVENDDPIPVVIRSNSFDEEQFRAMRGIASALAATEGRHPASINDLAIPGDSPRAVRRSPHRACDDRASAAP